MRISGITVMNLDTIPTSAALVCGQIVYNSFSTSAFLNKTSFSLDPHPELSKRQGPVSQD